MNEIVQFGRRNTVPDRQFQILEDAQRLHPIYDQGATGPAPPPINIQINLGRDASGGKDRRPFSFFGSKLVWLAISLAVAFGMTYGRTRMICQGFKETGKFYYGMDVDRCVGILTKNPLSPVEDMLATINRSY